MSNQASERLKQNAERIMQLWEKRVRDEVSASTHQDSLVLQDSLPLYLNQLIEALSDRMVRTFTQITDNQVESTRIGKQHGHERAGYADYSMSHLILEYHILRQVIFQVLEEEAPLGVEDRDIIIGSIEQAVNDAATQFSETLRDIQELFMVTLTHDLRGPLNVVKLGTQLTLRRLERGDSHIDVAARMLGAVNRLDLMIQDLLDASRLRAGQSLKMKFEECNLEGLLEDVAEDLSFAYGERFVVVSDADIRAYCSRKEIRRVIENLAINAVKYGDPSTPITLTLQQTETQINLTIHNQGKPISLDAQSILFQQFRRTISAEDQTGWGLGLFLAKSITEAHQGTLEVESGEGQGTSFIIKLPKVML
ncbi:sensor histidine kinase [Planktothrix pseudagardhii]|uniref:histidine kinase n=1 Tax=Planktothrix pseudagardhii TaxID=132604 RepID=A0A9W4CTT8_9CYAN|nr:HAMP domain-containing sensor histidine kinase [Planktothrix pseudagardhii]CAD5985759.1 Phosphate regulon sensor protein PhoR [Planktothrix pseudagardhii]